MTPATDSPPAVHEQLEYPCPAVPAPGEALAVAEGVLWLRMPLPMSLDHINVWALADGDGWTLVDTGMCSRETSCAWQQAFSGPLQGRPVTRVISTHMHPDHIGMAGWLTRRFRCRLWMTRLEYLTCRMLTADTGREAPEEALAFYRAAGWNEEAIDYYKAQFGNFGKGVYRLPDSYQRVEAGQAIDIGGRRWLAVIGQGHSPEHLCLWCPELQLLISGDQVLPRISSNVSVFPTEPEADPLSDWLASLTLLRATVPDQVLVLPAHNEPFRGLHHRLNKLIDGHEAQLARLQDALREPRRAVDVFSLLFRRPIGNDMMSLATGESLANLNCLMRRGLVQRETDAQGQLWYRAAAIRDS